MIFISALVLCMYVLSKSQLKRTCVIPKIKVYNAPNYCMVSTIELCVVHRPYSKDVSCFNMLYSLRKYFKFKSCQLRIFRILKCQNLQSVSSQRIAVYYFCSINHSTFCNCLIHIVTKAKIVYAINNIILP